MSRIGCRIGTDPLFGVSRDPVSLKYTPENALQWSLVMAAAGITSGGPGQTWLCQESSGNLADSIDSVTLTQSGSGHLYQQSVTGWSRKAVMTTDGTVGQKWVNSTTAPNPATVSTLWLAYISFPAIAPAANRCLMANSSSLDCRLTSTGKVSVINGASTTGTANPLNDVHPVLVKHDITNSTFVGYTDQEKLTGTFTTNASIPMFALGGQTAAPANAGYLFVSEFSGVAAELTDAQIKKLMQTLGFSIPWT